MAPPPRAVPDPPLRGDAAGGGGGAGHVMRNGEPGRPRVGSAAARVRCRLSMLPRGSAGYITGPGGRRQRLC